MAVSASVDENVVIAAGDCALAILPRFGGKISSIQLKGCELLQQPLVPIAARTKSMAFDEADASGWDECLPSVADCFVTHDDASAQIPDHGDLWRIPAEVIDRGSDASVTLAWNCFSLPLRLERTIALQQTPAGSRIQADYVLINNGASATPWSWAAHPLFAVEPGDRIVLPDSIHSLRLEGSGGCRLGSNGHVVTWPVAKLSAGVQTDLSIAQAPAARIGDKLFAGALAAEENWATLERPSVGLRIRIGFDPEKMPYLGLWLCYGGWPERPGPKQNCVAIEPATAPVDSLAAPGPWSRVLNPGETFTWSMTVDLELL